MSRESAKQFWERLKREEAERLAKLQAKGSHIDWPESPFGESFHTTTEPYVYTMTVPGPEAWQKPAPAAWAKPTPAPPPRVTGDVPPPTAWERPKPNPVGRYIRPTAATWIRGVSRSDLRNTAKPSNNAASTPPAGTWNRHK